MAEKKSIHEFSTGTPQAQTAFVVDTPNASAESGYVTEKVITSDLGNTILGTLNYTQSLNTESKNVFGAVNELNANKAKKSTLLSGSTNAVNVPAYTAMTLHSENLTQGNYIASCSIEFSSNNSTGTRRIGINTTSGDIASTEIGAFNGYASLCVTGAFRLEANATVNFFCRHSASEVLPAKLVAWSIVRVD